MKREFLMLAKECGPDLSTYSGTSWFVSEKLDGWRAFWDGGITTGRPKTDVPWANLDKDERYITPQIATGLWSRYGNVIHAPPDWIAGLPPGVMLDGEIYNPELSRAQILSISKRLPSTSDSADWSKLKLYTFDSPSSAAIFADGRVDACKRTFSGIQAGSGSSRYTIEALNDYYGRNRYLGDSVHWVTQSPADDLVTRLDTVTSRGGEGLMLRHRDSYWEPTRSKFLLKVKRLSDMEVIVTGYRSGKITTKGSRNHGKIGSLCVRTAGAGADSGLSFEVSGLNDAERELDPIGTAEALACPDCILESPGHSGQIIRVGDIITIRYRGLNDSGIPNEARYWRHHDA